MRRTLVAAAAAAGLLASASAFAHDSGMGSGCPMMGSGYGMGTGQGMGPGMMNGPGMMGRGQGMGMSPALPSDLDEAGLSSEQRAKIQDIRRDFQRKQWKAMESMHEAMWQRSDEMRKQIDAVLTPEQRQKLGRNAN